ncbi:hypothetical protein [Streptomyces sp. NPDC090445]|uniref:hypothetical protein n=1 Tax=Streptomyces sp. NPDC090445 TaxID=3365963 RepID=UPI0038077076
MVRRWSKAEMWVPGAYLALVVGLGFHAAVLVSALVNAAAIWALFRYTARRRDARSAQA